MSRIHEALQRAYRERGKMPVSEDRQVAELTIASVPNEPQFVKPELVLENIARHPWKPIATTFPTLTDRGAGVEQFRRLRSHIEDDSCRQRYAFGRKELCSRESGHEHGAQ
jgi:hypothetical protein